MFIVVLVAAIDMYWSIKVGPALQQTEENPVGRLLIKIDGGSSALFMSVKMVGTLLVVLAIIWLCNYRRWWAFTVSLVLAVMQVSLLLYLYGVIPDIPSLLRSSATLRR